jgi:hypothetical protein
MQLCSYAVVQLCSCAAMKLCSYAVMQSCNDLAAESGTSLAIALDRVCQIWQLQNLHNFTHPRVDNIIIASST